MPLHVAVVGAAGYAGSELLRLLPYHPGIGHIEAYARTPADVPWDGPVLPVEALEESKADVVFLAVPAPTARQLAPRLLEGGRRVVDLSGGHRLPDALYRRTYADASDGAACGVYGLTEWFGDEIAQARLVANPGCYATALLLLLLPLVRAGLRVPFAVASGVSGHSGAGRSKEPAHLLAEAMDDVRAYKVDHHVHVAEVEHVLESRFDAATELHFTPHLGPFARGILVTMHVPLDLPEAELRHVVGEVYRKTPFVRILPEGCQPGTRQVAGTNRADIGLGQDERGWAVLTCAIDNLGKGAAGQAIQNLNRMAALPETAGLLHPALAL